MSSSNPASPGQAGAPARTRIDIHDENEVRYWTKELGVDERTLKALVAAAGYSVEAVRERLRLAPPSKGPRPLR